MDDDSNSDQNDCGIEMLKNNKKEQDTYEALSSSEENEEQTNQIKYQEYEALSSSELKVDKSGHQQMFHNERQKFIEKLGDFSMSGYTASQIN